MATEFTFTAGFANGSTISFGLSVKRMVYPLTTVHALQIKYQRP